MILVIGTIICNTVVNLNLKIMKIAGTIFTILGIIGLVIFGIQAMNDSEHFSLLGMDVAVSSANWTPVIVSGVVAIVGIVLLAVRKR